MHVVVIQTRSGEVSPDLLQQISGSLPPPLSAVTLFAQAAQVPDGFELRTDIDWQTFLSEHHESAIFLIDLAGYIPNTDQIEQMLDMASRFPHMTVRSCQSDHLLMLPLVLPLRSQAELREFLSETAGASFEQWLQQTVFVECSVVD